MQDDDLDAMITHGTALIGLPVDPAWRESVRANLSVCVRFAALVEGFALDDEAEPAPVFRP